MLGVTRLLLIFVGGKVFEVVLSLTFMVLCSSLIFLMFEKEIRPCFVPLWLVVFGMVFSLVEFVVKLFLVGSVGLLTMMVIFFWDCPFPPLVEIRENPEFYDLMRLDKTHWNRCLLWHGWLPMLSGVNGASPWAVDASESAAYLLEVALGWYSSGLLVEWSPCDEFDHDRAASSLPDHPDVWTEAVWLLITLLVFPLLDLGFFLISLSIFGEVIGGVMLIMFVLILTLSAVEVFVQFLGLFNLFKELKCGVLVWPCSPLRGVHLGVDNLGVVRHVGRLLDSCRGTKPF